jgi:hypothetical protein
MDPGARPSPLALATGLSAGLAAGPGARLAPPPVDPSAATVVVRRRRAAAPPRARPRPAFVALGAFGLVLAGLVALAGLLGDGGANNPGTTPPATETVASPSPTPTLAPSPSPTPSPTPTPTPDPAVPAFEALDRVDSGIDRLDGNNDVRGKDINDLRTLAGDVREALVARDYELARERTSGLADKVNEVAEDANGDAIDALRRAVEDLAQAIPAG